MSLFYLPKELLLCEILPALNKEERQILRMTSSWFKQSLGFEKVDLCSYAAKKGYLKLIRWLRSNGAPWNKQVCSSAAKGGHLEVLQWIRANGAPWNEDVCYFAAKGGHLLNGRSPWVFQTH